MLVLDMRSFRTALAYTSWNLLYGFTCPLEIGANIYAEYLRCSYFVSVYRIH